ncbi:Hsp20/alpha crystallin family protein [Paenibacillus antibioticophila]|uniref:Hsp20/alpha crystallin family protein n=1 Tax=Paenibacillus antibioticophila TaxID=1274374 RepID=UPI0024B5B8D9|nr:Hsp20 family protein [Paenibacillus antibioticophila]
MSIRKVIIWGAHLLNILAFPIKGQKRSNKQKNRSRCRKTTKDGRSWLYVYVRRFYVQDIDEDSIRASLKDGLLKLEVPKRQPTQSKRIEIQV